jgi:hypothetical protein
MQSFHHRVWELSVVHARARDGLCPPALAIRARLGGLGPRRSVQAGCCGTCVETRDRNRSQRLTPKPIVAMRRTHGRRPDASVL